VGAGGAGASAPVKVSSYSQFDATLAYAFAHSHVSRLLDGLTVRVGANDLFNAQAPLAVNAFSTTKSDLGTYGAVGVEVFSDVTLKF
jgi:outer membrane receptor protein involved in Fe transport